MDQAVEPVTVSAAPALPTMPAGDAKVFQAGKAAIAKADTMDKLKEVAERMDSPQRRPKRQSSMPNCSS
jgi:hypothetical protein